MNTAGGRIRELDALRGLAALAVVAFHYTTRYNDLWGRAAPLGWSCSWGEHGVDLFFMISGFVILMTLERTPRAWEFAWHRFVRLFPVFWVAVLVTFTVMAWCPLPGQETTSTEALLNLTMIPAILRARLVDGVYWSLQTELFFYAAMLVLARCGLLKNLTATLTVWLIVATMVQGALSLGASQTAVAPVLTKLLTLLSLDYIHLFAIGMVCYRAWQRQRFTYGELALVAACVVWRGWFDDTWQVALLVAALAALLWIAVRGTHFLQAKWLIFVGTISYSLYLTHQNVGYVILQMCEQQQINANVGLLLALVASVGLATALTYGVERPAIAWLKPWPARRAATQRFRQASDTAASS